MTVEEQYAAIRIAGFYDDLITRTKSVHDALVAAGASADDSYTADVDGVPLRVTPGTDDSTVYLGLADDGTTPLYTWKLPTVWLVS